MPRSIPKGYSKPPEPFTENLEDHWQRLGFKSYDEANIYVIDWLETDFYAASYRPKGSTKVYHVCYLCLKGLKELTNLRNRKK